MIDTIIFDVDGTLVDTEHVVITSLQKTLKEELDHIVEDEKELVFALGIPGQKTLERYLDSKEEIIEVHKKWAANESALAHHAEVFEGIETVLKSLTEQGYKLGIVTSKTAEAMESDFDPLGLSHYFKATVTASDTEKHKPNPDPLLKAYDLLDAKPENSIYIGDSIYDLRSAQSSGAKFGLAEWGAHDYDEFKKSDYTFAQPEDLVSFFEDYKNK